MRLPLRELEAEISNAFDVRVTRDILLALVIHMAKRTATTLRRLLRQSALASLALGIPVVVANRGDSAVHFAKVSPPATIGSSAILDSNLECAAPVGYPSGQQRKPKFGVLTTEFGADSTGMSDAVSAIQAAFASSPDVTHPPGTFLVAASATLGAFDTTHHFARGAMIKVAAGATLTLQGTIEAPFDQKIFDVSAEGASVVLVGGDSRVYVGWFGSNTSALDNTAAINASIGALPADGGTIEFPPGTTKFASPISLSAKRNLTFHGAGARFMQDFADSPSILLYTGSIGPAIHISTNNGRNFQLENMEIRYDSASFTDNLILVESTAGITFRHSAMGGMPTAASAAAVVAVKQSEKVTISDCIVQFAQRCVYLPPAPGASSLLTIRDSQLVNVTYAHLEVVAGSALGLTIDSSLFDNTHLSFWSPPHGVLVNSTGFKISGCTFAGSNADATPNGFFVDLAGAGEFTGNTILTNKPGIVVRAGGSYLVSGNVGYGSAPFAIRGGCVKGGGNTWIPSTFGGAQGNSPAVDIDTAANSCVLDIGPDFVEAVPASKGHYTGESYYVHPSNGSTATTGMIKYDPGFDQSDGPTTTVAQVVLANQRFQSMYETDLPKWNIGAGSDTLAATCIVPANAVDKKGKGMRFRAWGTTSADARAKQVKVYWGAVLIANYVGNANGVPWEIHGEVYRGIDATHQEWIVSGSFNGKPLVPAIASISTEDLTKTINLTVFLTGESADGQITLDGFRAEAIQ